MDRQARLTHAGAWIHQQRTRAGLNVHSFADAIGVSSKSVYQWEAGKSDIGATVEEVDERARQMAEIFDMDLLEVRRNLVLFVAPPSADGEQQQPRQESKPATYLAELIGRLVTRYGELSDREKMIVLEWADEHWPVVPRLVEEKDREAAERRRRGAARHRSQGGQQQSGELRSHGE